MTSHEKLSALFKREPDGSIDCIPVLGSGVNLEAARLENEQEDNWSGLLQKITIEMKENNEWLNSLPHSNLARWESMLRFWALQKKIEPYQAETELQKFACEYLRQKEKKASKWKLYSEFAGARFTDILSLNFDRRVALSLNKPKFISAPKKCPEGTHGETLYRHDLLSYSGGCKTRIWYPHGDTKKFSTLKLGIRKYGVYVVSLEEAESDIGESWRYKRSWDNMDSDDPAPYDAAPKWTDVFSNRTVAFIGCGLSLDEWPLWWSIRKRGNVKKNDDRNSEPHTFFITAGNEFKDSFLQSVLIHHNIVVIHFPSFDEMWKSIRTAIA